MQIYFLTTFYNCNKEWELYTHGDLARIKKSGPPDVSQHVM